MRLLIVVVVNSLSTLINIGKRPFLESSKSQKATRKPMLSLAAVAATPMHAVESVGGSPSIESIGGRMQ